MNKSNELGKPKLCVDPKSIDFCLDDVENREDVKHLLLYKGSFGLCWIAIMSDGKYYTIAGNGDCLSDDLNKVESFLWEEHAKWEA